MVERIRNTSVVNNSNQYELINFLKNKKGDTFTNVEIVDLARNGDLEKALILKIPQNILSEEEQEALGLFNQSILEKNNQHTYPSYKLMRLEKNLSDLHQSY